MAVNVTITTSDGKAYTNPRDIKVPRNKNTEAFYRILDNWEPKKKENDVTA